MSYIDNWFHFYSTTESFEVHRKQGLINPDSICFLKETGQIYTQNSFFGICRERYEKLEQLVLDHDAKIKDILGIEGPSVKDGIVNNIADLVNFLDGFTDEDNLKDFLDAMRTALENQISAVNKALSDRITALEDEIHNDSESLHNAIKAINSQIETIDIRLDNHDTAISALNTSLASHIREYNLLKTNYENFKAYAETKFTAIDSSISSINISIATLQQEFTNLDEKFDDVENEVSEVKALLEDAKLLVRELEDRFGETLAAIEQFKKDVNDEIDDFKALVGAPNGMAPLDGDAKVPAAYLPSYVDDVLEYATRAAFPVTGETGKIYVSLDDNLTYRWSGSTYIEISKSLGLGETATTAYPGNKGKKNADDIAAHKADTNNPHNVTKTQLGLDKVNNTSDADKPVSTAQAAAIKVVQDDLTSHKGNKANPHEVTKAQVGLSNVDNTADLDKPISKATQAALDVLDTSLDTHIADKTNPHNVTKEQLGLGNVENTADKDKPISDATQNVLDTKVDKIVGKGLSTNDFTNEDKAKLDRATTVNDEGKISAELIPVDEEDLTVHSITDTNKVVRLKDRDTTNGMGYKILRLPEDGILTQAMINQANTIYEIRYNFDLNGATIHIPENCVLKFAGGKLSNGTLVGSNTTIKSDITKIFELSIEIGGTWNTEYAYAEWFGAKPNVSTLDNTDYFKKTLDCFQSVHLSRSEYYLKKPLLLGNKNYINGNKGKLNFTITDTGNPCCIKMGAHCVVEDITIEIDDTNSTEGTAVIWFQSDYMRATQDAANDYTLSYRSAQNYALRNIDMVLKNKMWMETPVFKYTGIKVTGEDYPISSGIASNFRIRGYWKYGIYIDLSDATVDTTEGWFTSGQFTNGSIGSSLFGIYIDSSSTHKKNVPPTGLMFTNISIQTMGRFIKSLFESNTETRAIKLKECREITFRDCYLWDWTDKCFGSYYNTPAPVSISPKSLNIIFDNTGGEYIKLYDIEQPLTSEFLDNPPTVRNRSTLRFRSEALDDNITKEDFKKFFICLPNGSYSISKKLLSKFVEYTVNLKIDDIDNLIVNNNAVLRISNNNMFRIFELEIGITDYSMITSNSYYLYRAVVTLGSAITSNNFENVIFRWFRVPVNNLPEKIYSGNAQCGNKGEYYINSSKNNIASFCVGNNKWIDSRGYSVALSRGATTSRPTVSTEENIPDGSITPSDIGFPYFDTTLGRTVYWDGAKWVDPVAEATSWKIIR